MAQDIKDTKELIKLVASFAKAFKQASADGTVNIADLALLIQVIPSLGPALDGITSIPEELADIDATELEEIIAEVKAVVGELSDEEKYLEIASKALKAGFELYGIYQLVK